MHKYSSYLEWIHSETYCHEMEQLLISWVNINSSSDNISGLSNMLAALQRTFRLLEGEMKIYNLPPYNALDERGEMISKPLGRALHIRKHSSAPIQIFLGGHMDTVYPTESPFQLAARENGILRGPGVADMKGGLMILFTALLALERSPYAGKIGWEVLINPDEEIGSIGSKPLLIEAAHRNHLGLIFEPSLPNGALVSDRKGSTNITLVARGVAAHAGRDFHKGKNAIVLLSQMVLEAAKLTDIEQGITVNIGHIKGGGPLNVIPNLAIAGINIRVTDLKDMDKVCNKIYAMASAREIEFHELSMRHPKPFTPSMKMLLKEIGKSAADLGQPAIKAEPSGGACDGNILAHEGLLTLDSLGAIGSGIHTSDEQIQIKSLADRSALVAHFLMRVANQEVNIS